MAYNIQNNIITRHFETIPEKLPGHNMYVTACATAASSVQPILGNHQICGTATNINAAKNDFFFCLVPLFIGA